MADVSILNPLDHPLAFAKRTLQCAALWGGFSFTWQLAFERYAALLEKKGYLAREAHEPTIPRLKMLYQSLFGIAGTALPSALVQAFFNPQWTFDLSIFGSLALVPYVFSYVLLFDAYYYWGHRIAHAVPWVYRLVHKKHHLPQASLDAGSTSYMSFLEGFLLSGLPFAPNLLLPILCFRGNFWVAGITYYTVLCLFYLGHAGCAIKKDILPVFLLNPFLIVLGVTANASRPQDHTAHHERVVCNYAVFFRLWDEMCGTAAPPKRGEELNEKTKQLPISWRVMLYNALNFFSFFALPLLAAGFPLAFFGVLVACALGLVPFGLEATLMRLTGLTALVTRLPFWDGLRRDLRVSVATEREVLAAAAAAAPAAAASTVTSSISPSPELVAVVSLPRLLSAPLLSEGGAAAAKQHQKKQLSLGGCGGAGRGDESDGGGCARSAHAGSLGGALGHLNGDDECPSPGGARSPLIAASSLRHHHHEEEDDDDSAMATATEEEGDGDAEHNTTPTAKLYVYHPRGDLMRGAFFAFGARGSDPTHPLAAQRDVRLALPAPMARVLLRLPLLRELVALLGGVEPSSVTSALKSGASVAVCLPGPPTRGPPRPAVAPETAPAFLRAALASGAALVPVVAVGEAELAGRLPLRDKWVMPSRPGCPVRVVFGEPIPPAEGESAQRLRARFAAALAALAARHGAPPPELADL
jgi:sterol desaturase/sphingolipid hydroxylase (fatty acid hydroxylase superfamily)